MKTVNWIFNKKNFPNFLTILRILILIPYIVIFFILFLEKNKILTNKEAILSLFSFFIIAVLSDFLDGFLARKWKQESEFGKFWDPLADKFLTGFIYFSFSLLSWSHIIFLIIFILRDFLVDWKRQQIIKNKNIKNKKIAAGFWGKLKTIFQFLSILTIFLFIIFYNNFSTKINKKIFFWLINIPTIIACFLSVFSGWIYLVKYNKIIKNSKKI